MSHPAPIVIIGAGIIGLTTAVCILESEAQKTRNNAVHIIAEHLPDDPLDAYYASTIAGAHHLSFAANNDARQRRWDSATFHTMYNEWKEKGEMSGLMAIKQTELYVGTRSHLAIYEEHPDFEVLDTKTLSIPGIDHAISFTSLTITPAVYLSRLLDRIRVLSGGTARIHRYRLPSLTALYSPQVKALIGDVPPAAVIVCVGIGALTLGDLEDITVYPTRGQVIKIRAPWIRNGWTRQVGDLNGGEGGERTYVIPRPSGEVILGGTRDIGDWHPYPRDHTKADIIQRALEICPQLRPAHFYAPGLPGADGQINTSSVSVLNDLVIQHLVGFRPSRRAGARLERGEDVASTAVIYNYGHGGAGWQSCWGSAEDTVSLVNALH